MVRAPFYDKSGVKKGAWSREEDERLRAYIQSYGHSNWRKLPKLAGLTKCGKSCRLRWLNYLRPNLKHGDYTQEEEEVIIQLHQKLGNKWSLIAKTLPGRTDNEIKNYWHSHLSKKCLKSKEITTSNLNSKPIDTLERKMNHQIEKSESSGSAFDIYHIFESSLPMSPKMSSLEAPNSTSLTSKINVAQSTINYSTSKLEDDVAYQWVTFEEFGSNFWTKPFLVERSAYTNDMCGDEAKAFLDPYFNGGYTDLL